jgi:hypothetical protein
MTGKPISGGKAGERTEMVQRHRQDHKMNKEDAVTAFLREHGCPQHVIRGGLKGLVEDWESVVDSVEAGYALTLDDYLNDLDGRQLLGEALAVAPEDQRQKYLERLEHVDAWMRRLIRPAGKCLWGENIARTEGWTPEKNWWYFSQPIDADPELLAEIEEI